MSSSEALRRGLSVHNMLSPRLRSLQAVALAYAAFMEETTPWREPPDPMEAHFRRAAVMEYGWVWDGFFQPQTRAEWNAFYRRIHRNGPSLKKKHARYHRIWLAALALRVKE
jgi:hypothetical protein